MIYKVEKRTPTKVISEEFYSNKMLSKISRDIINSGCNDYEGALIEIINIEDCESVNESKVEFERFETGIGQQNCAIYFPNGCFLNFDIENLGNAMQNESHFEAFEFVYYDGQNEEETLNLELHRDTIKLINEFVSEQLQDEVTEYADNEKLNEDNY